MKKTYRYSARIESDRVDFNFNLTVPSMLGYFQTLATNHSIDLGCDYFTMKNEHNAFWVVTKVKLQIDKFPKFNDKISLATWYEKPSLVRCPRVYEIKDASGNTCVTALSEWCALDADSFKPKKMTEVFDGSLFRKNNVDITFEKNTYDIDDSYFEFDRVVRLTDIDMNVHTNNIIYSRMVMDTFSVDFMRNNTLKDFEIDYINQSMEGDVIKVYQKEVSKGYFTVVGISQDKCIFRAFLSFEENKEGELC